jgi:magnesium-transporting ATPase (P-type)
MLLANLSLTPFAEKPMNFVNVIAQLNLCAFLFVALLLKVDLDNTGDSPFFAGIVAAMAILPIVLPIVMRIYISLYGSLEMRMLVKDSKWET